MHIEIIPPPIALCTYPGEQRWEILSHWQKPPQFDLYHRGMRGGLFSWCEIQNGKEMERGRDGDSGGREGDRGPEGPDIHSTDSDRYQFEESSCWCLYRGAGSHFLTISLPAVCQLNWMAGEWLHPRLVGALDTFLETTLIWVYLWLGREKGE